MRHDPRRTALFAFIALSMVSPAAQADAFDDAWQCASAAVDGVTLAVGTGAKALKFVATQPDCITRMGTPATAAPIGVVIGLGNAGVLPTSQPSCSAELYNAAAKPIAAGLNGALGSLGVLPESAQTELTRIASGELSGALLAQIPGMDVVTGSLTCGCELMEVGLTIDAIEEVLNTADRIGDACGGEVWKNTKKVVGAVVNFAGEAAEEGVRQVSNVGDALAGQTKHIGLQQYFDENWRPKVEDFALFEFNNPGSWHTGRKWKEIWDPCVSYFDEHTMSEDNSQDTCDDMRSGTNFENGMFLGNGFQQRMFRRAFDFEVTAPVDQARTQAYIDYADLKPKFVMPKELVDDSDAYAQVASASHAKRPAMIRAAIDKVYGVATREKKHNGLVVSNAAPATVWPNGTVGDRALGFYDEVKVGAGDGRANAGKAVQLALAQFDVADQIRVDAGVSMLAFYNQQYAMIKMTRDIARDKNQEQVDLMISHCPDQACRDTIENDWNTCRQETREFHDANADLIANFDTQEGQRASKEWSDREAACLAQARKTSKEASTVLMDSDGPNSIGPVDGIGTRLPSGMANPVTGSSGSGSDRLRGSSSTATEPRQDDSVKIDRRDLRELLQQRPEDEQEQNALAVPSPRELLRQREPISVDTNATRDILRRREQAAQVTDPSRDVLRRREPLTVEPEAGREVLLRREPVTVEPNATREIRRSREPLTDVREPLTEVSEPATGTTLSRRARVDPAISAGVSTVSGADLPDCSAVRGEIRPRRYACSTQSAFEHCKEVIRDEPNIQCSLDRR